MRRTLFIIGLVTSFLLTTPAQQTEPAAGGLQYLDVAVTNDNWEWITGLKQENFKLFAVKAALNVEEFSSIAEPVSVGFLIDRSASTESVSFPIIAEALRIHTVKANPENEYFVVAFDKSQTFLLRPGQEAHALADAITQVRSLKAAGETDVAAAMRSGLNTFASVRWPRRTLVIVSDMLDFELSNKKVKELRENVRRYNATVFGIVIGHPRNYTGLYGLTALGDLASESGGRVFYPQTNREMNEILYWIAEDLQYQYSIGFRPVASSPKKPDEWQKLEVKVELPPGIKAKGKLVVRHRGGYYPVADK